MKATQLRKMARDEEVYPKAVLLCIIGFFLYLILSAPVLNMLGIPYGSADAGLLTKIHPGSYFIILSFFVLLCSHGDPLTQIIAVARKHTAFFILLIIYALILVYWILRGPKGFGLILDTHIVLPITAIVFSYAPRPWYKRIVYAFVGFAVLNAAIGIVESLTHLRLFPFDPEWEVLQQDYFRASALLGHPLNNALFDGIAIFIMLSVRMPIALKSAAFLIMLTALVGFGGRSALVVTCAGSGILGCHYLWHYFTTQRMTIPRIIAVVLALFLVPSLCGGMLYGALHSEMGERLIAYDSLEDDSASIRVASFNALHYLSASDAILGIDADQVDAIASHVDIASPSSDIENPWILMFMFLGGIMFTLWLCGLGGMVWRLMAGASLELKMAVICYFIIASTSNSFGRKDAVFLLMVGMVVCAKKLQVIEKNDR